jgi:DNA polymerase-3 subunit gamma/tau
MWATQIAQYAHLVKFQTGHIELRIEDLAHPKLAQETARLLSQFSGQRWMVSVSGAAGEPTLAEQRRAAYDARLDAARAHPLVADVLSLFPGATLDIQTRKED